MLHHLSAHNRFHLIYFHYTGTVTTPPVITACGRPTHGPQNDDKAEDKLNQTVSQIWSKAEMNRQLAAATIDIHKERTYAPGESLRCLLHYCLISCDTHHVVVHIGK